MLTRGLDIGVGHAKISAPIHFQDFGGACGFFGAKFRSAARAHFSCRKVKDAGLVALLPGFEKCAAASEFHIVRMCGNGEKVESHERSGNGRLRTGTREILTGDVLSLRI